MCITIVYYRFISLKDHNGDYGQWIPIDFTANANDRLPDDNIILQKIKEHYGCKNGVDPEILDGAIFKTVATSCGADVLIRRDGKFIRNGVKFVGKTRRKDGNPVSILEIDEHRLVAI